MSSLFRITGRGLDESSPSKFGTGVTFAVCGMSPLGFRIIRFVSSSHTTSDPCLLHQFAARHVPKKLVWLNATEPARFSLATVRLLLSVPDQAVYRQVTPCIFMPDVFPVFLLGWIWTTWMNSFIIFSVISPNRKEWSDQAVTEIRSGGATFPFKLLMAICSQLLVLLWRRPADSTSPCMGARGIGI